MNAGKSASFGSEDVLPQNFPFSKPVMDHIFVNANAEVFKKFNQSCKLFFAKFSYNIIGYLSVGKYSSELDAINTFIPPWKNVKKYSPKTRRTIFNKHTFSIQNPELMVLLSNNLWISNILQLNSFNNHLFDKLLSKIIRCDIKNLSIRSTPNLPLKYFNILTESGGVKELELERTHIFHSVGETDPLSFDKILECVPNADSISINPCHTVSKNMKEFALLHRKMKFKKIELLKIDQTFILKHLVDFFVNNVENEYLNDRCVRIRFRSSVFTDGFYNHLRIKLKEIAFMNSQK